MRLVGLSIAALAVSTALSGCSFIGRQPHAPGAQYSAQQGFADLCQVAHARAPLPRGCHPSQVTIGAGPQFGGQNAFAGGFPQQPQFGHNAQLATGGYGTHAGGNVHTAGLHGSAKPRLRKPRFRGSLDLGVEKSYRGDLIDVGGAGLGSPFAGYDSSEFNQGAVIGTPPDGQVRLVDWSSGSRPRTVDGAFDERRQPNISFDDAWSTPASFGLGGEYIVSDRASVFGRVGYTVSEGSSGTVASQEATVYQDNTIFSYEQNQLLSITDGGSFFRPNTTVSRVSYDFSDMNRLDLEAGGRLYFNPVAGQDTGRTITPFVGAAAGASRYNGVSFKADREQLFYDSAIGLDGVSAADADLSYYDLDLAGQDTPTQIYDAQWVPSGRLNVGAEWQVTPKTALAFETGLRVEGARDYSNGVKGDTNVSVPVTLRGSFNF